MLLCVKLASRGDLLLAAPAFRELRRLNPARRIVLLVGESCVDVARHLPYFDEIRTVDDTALFASGLADRARAAWRLFREIRAARSEDVVGAPAEVLIFHQDWRYGLVARLARVRVRRGLSGRGGARFLTHPHVPPGDEHYIDRYLGMAGLGAAATNGTRSLAGVWAFPPGGHGRHLRVAEASGFDPAAGPWVGLGFGGGKNVKTRTDLKSWPIERYREAARELLRRGYRVVWLGNGEDAETLGSHFGGLNLAGRLSVPETAAVVGRCDVVVANDTLILHLAEALAVPTVAIFGPTDPAHYRPRSALSEHLWKGAELPCSPCHRDGYYPACRFDHGCMAAVPAGEVLEAVKRVLGAAGAARLSTSPAAAPMSERPAERIAGRLVD